MSNPSSGSFSGSALHILLVIVLLLSLLVAGAGNWLYSFFKGDIDNIGLWNPPAPVSQNVAGIPPFNYSGQIYTLSGKDMPIAAMKNKVVFIHFWATWCPPCIKELPEIQRLFDEMKNMPNLYFMMVANENQVTVQTFINEKKYRFPVYLADQFLLKRMQVNSFPSTFIIDQNGKTVFKVEGAASWDNEPFKAFVKGLL